jgi:hypothetical protein
MKIQPMCRRFHIIFPNRKNFNIFQFLLLKYYVTFVILFHFKTLSYMKTTCDSTILRFYDSTILRFYNSTILQFYNSTTKSTYFALLFISVIGYDVGSTSLF